MKDQDNKTSKVSCETCKFKQDRFLCHLSPAAAREFETIRTSIHHPAGSILFLENESPRGVFIVCSGQIKLSVNSRNGKTLILQLAKPGEVMGLSAAMSNVPYEASAEALYPSEVAFIGREDFLRFVKRFPEAYQAVTRQLNLQYERACNQLRTIGLGTTAHEKLARLFLHWSSDEKPVGEQSQIRIPLTHEQIAACLGSTRETVTRTISDLKSKHLVTLKGATVMIPNRSALMKLCGD